jgi:hypothetical protein
MDSRQIEKAGNSIEEVAMYSVRCECGGHRESYSDYKAAQQVAMSFVQEPWEILAYVYKDGKLVGAAHKNFRDGTVYWHSEAGTIH